MLDGLVQQAGSGEADSFLAKYHKLSESKPSLFRMSSA